MLLLLSLPQSCGAADSSILHVLLHMLFLPYSPFLTYLVLLSLSRRVVQNNDADSFVYFYAPWYVLNCCTAVHPNLTLLSSIPLPSSPSSPPPLVLYAFLLHYIFGFPAGCITRWLRSLCLSMLPLEGYLLLNKSSFFFSQVHFHYRHGTTIAHISSSLLSYSLPVCIFSPCRSFWSSLTVALVLSVFPLLTFTLLLCVPLLPGALTAKHLK